MGNFHIYAAFSISLMAVPVLSWSKGEEQNKLSTPVQLDTQAQQSAGIKTQILQTETYQPEFTAFGTALNIMPLMELRHRYQLAQFDRASAQAKYHNSSNNIKRQQNLYQSGIASKRSLQAYQLQTQVDKVTADAAKIKNSSIVDEAILVWGKQLTEQLLSENSPQFNEFLTGQQILLQVTLPANQHLAHEAKTVFIEPSGKRNLAFKANLIGPAPQSDNMIQGENYFFKTENSAIRPGMRVTVWIPGQGNQRVGVIIPKNALIWYLEQSYVYIKSNQDTFTRQEIDRVELTPKGYFIADQLRPGDEVVAQGAQLLLSEEFRMQIPQEDKD
jgi:hypothetical protein